MMLPTRMVYAYYFPEARKIIADAASPYPNDIYLQSINPGLVDFHLPVIQAYLNFSASQLPALKKFPYQYNTAGASEGIFHLLSQIAAKRPTTPLYILEGEYEGYAGYGKNLGLNFEVIPFESDFKKLSPGIFFISNPSARDGNIIPNHKIAEVGDAGHEIILDASYVSLTAHHQFLTDHPAISTVLVSLSKPFGLYYYRVGFCFSRQELPTLAVNKWFKNIFSLIVAKKLLETFSSTYFYETYLPAKEEAIAQFTQDFGYEIHSSDVLLLGNLKLTDIKSADQAKFQPYNRQYNYRFCLTSYLLDQETR